MSPSATPITLSGWALVLGASSGFGEATSLALARAGLSIFGVHLDRRATLPNVERIVAEIRGMGREAHFFNVNAADDEKRVEVAGDPGQQFVGEGGDRSREVAVELDRRHQPEPADVLDEAVRRARGAQRVPQVLADLQGVLRQAL